MKSSMSYITATATIASSTTAVCRLVSGRTGALGSTVVNSGPHTLDPIGYEADSGRVYMLEHFDDETGDPPRLLLMQTMGRHVGKTAPLHGWPIALSEPAAVEGESEFEACLSRLRASLIALEPMDPDLLRLQTRVARRRALRLFENQPPIRKFDLRLTVRPVLAGRVASIGAVGSASAYLRPRARIRDAFRIASQPLALAIVEYVGIPFDLGYHKDMALLVPLV